MLREPEQGVKANESELAADFADIRGFRTIEMAAKSSFPKIRKTFQPKAVVFADPCYPRQSAAVSRSLLAAGLQSKCFRCSLRTKSTRSSRYAITD